jgi:hypothetical protein
MDRFSFVKPVGTERKRFISRQQYTTGLSLNTSVNALSGVYGASCVGFGFAVYCLRIKILGLGWMGWGF